MTGNLSQRLHNLERFVFRPLFVFTTFVLVLFAAFQVGGRLTLAVAHLFTDEVNRVVGSQGIELQGMRGGWVGFNPVVYVDTVVFPAGTIERLDVEIDILETILRSSMIARRIAVDRADVHLDKVDGQWQLRGARADAELPDVTTLLEHSDEISGTVQLVFTSGEQSETLVGHLAAVNRGGQHQVSLSLLNPAAEHSGLHVAAQRAEAVPGVKTAASRVTAEGELAIPAVLAGMRDVAFRVSEGQWASDDLLGAGKVRLEIVNLSPPGVDAAFAVSTEIAVVQRDNHWDGVARDLNVSGAGNQFAFAPLRGRYRQESDPTALDLARVLTDKPDAGPALRLWLSEIDLAEFSRFAGNTVAGWEPVGRWIQALDVVGHANNVHAFFDPESGFGFLTSLSDLAMQGYKGAPTLRNIQGTLWGHERGMAVRINADEIDIQFPDLFHDMWRMNHIQGFVKAWFGPGYFAMRGTDLKAELPETSVGGGFALTRPDPRYEQRVTLTLAADALDLNEGRTFIPYKIPDDLSRWLESGPREGVLSNVGFAYHGQVHTRPDELGRRIELESDLSGATVEYDQAWPLVSDLDGVLHVAGVDTRVTVRKAKTRGLDLTNTEVELKDNGAYAIVDLNARIEGNRGVDFIRTTPLAADMPFVTEEWSSAGLLLIEGQLVVPIQDTAPMPLGVELGLDAQRFSLDMPDYRTSVVDLVGRGTFSLPHMLKGDFSGILFGEPASLRASPDPEWLRFDITGAAREHDLYELIEFEDLGVLRGRFEFDAELNLVMDGPGVSHLTLLTEFAGAAVNLPGHLAKSPDAAEPSEFEVQFLPDYQSVRWTYKDTNGWIHVDDEVLRGAIGINAAPPMTQQSESAIAIDGSMESVRLSDWVSTEGEAAVSLPLDWRIVNLSIGTLLINDLEFPDILLKGEQRGEDVWFGFASPDLTGEVDIPDDAMMTVDLDHVRFPVSDPELDLVKGLELDVSPDPLSPDVGRALPTADVNVSRLDLGDEPFGSWRFQIERDGEQVHFKSLVADVNGVHIKDSFVEWDLRNDVSTFHGAIELDDLEETLPKWDYAPSVQTESASLTASSSWDGSPANVTLIGLRGDISFSAENGRFQTVQTAQGALRIMSLLNLSTILGRIGGDFSDLTGSGVTFKKVAADVHLDAGLLEFRDRLFIDSTASNFEIGGRVDLYTGELDNEMIVTLPVSKSLPWYAVYLSLTNPIGGAALLIGERVLREPIQQLSSGKYRVTGTLEEPDVDWVGIFDKTITSQSYDPESNAEAVSGLVESSGK